KGPVEPYHEVGSPGEPPFQNGWTNGGGSTGSSVAFFKDPFGIVHLKGHIFNNSINGNTAFTLPDGYRPNQDLLMAGATAPYGTLEVTPEGQVVPLCAAAGFCVMGIDALTFRAG